MKYDPVTHVEATLRKRICAVVVTFNRLEKLKKTIEALASDDIDEIIVVDNGSTDGTGAWLKTQQSATLRPVMLPENLGGSGGFEAGVRAAVEDPTLDWLVLMDDDAHPVDGAIARFRDVAEPGAVHAAAVYYPDGSICEMNRPSVNPFWNIGAFARTLIGGGRMGFHIPDDAFDAEPRDIDVASFVGFFLPVSAVRQVGYPDGSLFIYGDDVMYSIRLRKAGIKVRFDPRLRFEHDCGTKDRQTGKVLKARWKIYYLYRNGIFMYRAISGWLYPAVLPVFLVKWFLTVGAHKPANRIERRLFWLAVRDGFAGRRDRPHQEIRALSET